MPARRHAQRYREAQLLAASRRRGDMLGHSLRAQCGARWRDGRYQPQMMGDVK